MSGFEIRDPARLSFRRCVEMVLSGIRFRLFRASVTVAIITLAVAFLMTILSEAMIGRAVAGAVARLARPRQVFLSWTQRLGSPMDEAALTDALASLDGRDARAGEFGAWGGCGDGAVRSLADLARREKEYVAFFGELAESDRRLLVGRATGRGCLAALLAPGALEAFERSAQRAGLGLPGGAERFRGFLREWADAEAQRRLVLEGHRRAVDGVRERLAGRPLVEALASDDGLRDAVAGLGFRPDAGEWDVAREQARGAYRWQRILSVCGEPGMREQFAVRFEVKKITDVTTEMWTRRLASAGGAAWMVDECRRTGRPLGMSAAEVREAARARQRDERIGRIEGPEAGGGAGGRAGGETSGRMVALVAVSLVVCIVGIANAMLMSVTERFTEIATMKCLGATDGFLMISFVIEAGFQGLVGGLAGAVLGAALGVLRASVGFGAIALRSLPFAALAAGFAGALAVGICLSMLAAVCPARVAARLSPMEAMRVE